jgi:hypothetical protein
MTSHRAGTEMIALDVPTDLLTRLRHAVGPDGVRAFIAAAVSERLSAEKPDSTTDRAR